MRKILSFCLSVFFIINTVSSQSLDIVEKRGEKAPIQKELIQKSTQNWEVQFADTLDPGCTTPMGTVSDGSFLYAGSVNKSMIFKISFESEKLDSFAIAGIPKSALKAFMIGLAYDGTHFFMTNGSDTIYVIDLNLDTGIVIDKIPLPANTFPLGITYAPDADNNNGGFWISIGTDYGVKLASRSGDILDSIKGEDLNYASEYGPIWGLAYDNLSAGGPFLYGIENLPQNIICINPANKSIHAPIHNVAEDMPDWENYYTYSIYVQHGVVGTTNTLGVLFMSGFHIGYDMAGLELPAVSLTIKNSYTKPWLKLNETGIISANVYHSGNAVVTSYDYNYSIDDVVYTENVTDANIALVYPIKTLEHSTTFTPTEEGTYDLKIWFSNINGDASATSDTFNMKIITYQKVTQRTVLHEVFSSSTCPPCAGANILLKSIFEENPDKFTCVKYQMNWPSPGDPYFTLEGNDRKTYYDVQSVPYLAVDGNYYNDNPSLYSSELLLMEYLQPSFVEMNATFVYDNNQKFHTTVTINPLKTFTGNKKLFVALVESVTRMNAKTNGEKQFFYVFKKFMTDSKGNSISLQDGEEVKVDLAFHFQGKFRLPFNAGSPIDFNTEHSVENFKNMMLVYWIQDYDTKEVLQSGKVDKAVVGIEDLQDNKGNVKIYPNPAEGMINIQSETLFSNIKVLNLLGQVVYNIAVNTNEYILQTSDLAPGLYILQLQTENGLITKKISVK